MKVKISSLNLETTLDEFIKSWKNEINEELWEEFNEEGYLDDEYHTGLVMEKNEDNSVSIEITPDFSNIDIINSVYDNKYALLVKDVFGPLNDDFYHKLSDEEREERAQFAYEACVISRDRLINTKAEQRFLKMSEEEAREFQLNTGTFEMFRNFLFTRVMPNLKRIGLLTDEVRPKFEALGLLEYENAPDDFECDWAEMKKPLEKFCQIPTAL